MMLNKEFKKFYTNIQEEIKALLISEEDGTTPEQVFTEYALSLLADAGETENFRVCYDEKISKRGIEHKINAYALYENYETLDLFITIYIADIEVKPVSKTDAERGLDRLTKFFRNAIYKDYVNEIEESSQVFDLAQTLANAPEIREFLTRVNVFLITNGEVKSDPKPSEKVAGYPVFYRIVDIQYLFNISETSRLPIEIDFTYSEDSIPCIRNVVDNENYQSYLAIMPGAILADIYEQYGPRLLEQNVRSFLQFTGKINKGIRKTILEEPHMFLAFNNGIAATAEEVNLVDLPNNGGKAISYVKDFQIVNGGQTTASIYHTWKKNKADISRIYIQLKLTVIRTRENFAEIVGRIAEYANTQNRISASDLSSNKEGHIILEKLTRTIWAPPKTGQTQQTRWFFERARGQFRSDRQRQGLTPTRRKAFDIKNPRSQLLTKELVAKYTNTYKEIYRGKKLVIGPHIVVRGSQKNYAQFLNYNFDSKPDNIYFEDLVAKAILFKTSESIYGRKPNAIGDMRYVTVPYSIAWLNFKLNYKLDLYKIWKQQQISERLREKLYEIMVVVERFIKENAPGSLYGEWAKKEDCWNALKTKDLEIDLDDLNDELQTKSSSQSRKRISDDETSQKEIQNQIELLKSIHPKAWKRIEMWGRSSGRLSKYQCDMAFTLQKNIEKDRFLSERERRHGEQIIEIVSGENPEIFYDMENLFQEDETNKKKEYPITFELIEKIVKWDLHRRRLKPYEYKFMVNLLEGEKSLSERNTRIARMNLEKVMKYGFRP